MKTNPKLVVLLGALGVSLSPIFVKLSNSQALTIAFYRMLMTVILLTPFIIAKNRNEIKGISRSIFIRIIISGVFLGLHFSTWIMSLKFTTVASATVLVNTSPIILLLITYFVFKEKTTKTQVMAIIAAFTGSIILTFGDFFGGQNALLGDLFAILGAVFVSFYLLIGNKVRQDISMTSYTYLTYSFAAMTIFITNLFVGHDLLVKEPTEYMLFLAMAIFPTLLGHSLFNWSLKYVSATFVSMAILTEPIIASIMAVFIFSEIPTVVQLVGSVIVITSIGIYNNTKK